MVKKIKLTELAGLFEATILSDGNQGYISSICIDSRRIYPEPEILFVALPGEKTDGHSFLKAAYEGGVRNFLVQKGRYETGLLRNYADTTILLVCDTLRSLQFLAAWNRNQFQGPVLAITGSNGKTIVKEWLGQLLEQHYRVVKSPKSYNSQIGVPLSIFTMAVDHQVAVLEAGISQPGEMRNLEEMIRPTIGLFTNLGTAHDGNFSGKDEKLKEKALLFSGCQYIIYRKDQLAVAAYFQSTFMPERLISWSETEGADYTLAVRKEPNKTKIILLRPDLSLFTFNCSFSDEASLENLRHVIVACLTLGLSPTQIQDAIPLLRSVDMRLTVKAGLRQCTLIDDTYNNDLGGLVVALEFMQVQRQKRRRKVILSDLPQLGSSKNSYHKVKTLLDHFKIDEIYGIGMEIGRHLTSLEVRGKWFANTDEFLRTADLTTFDNDLILIKGGRTFAFEKIVQALEERIHGTVLAINLNALTHNYFFYRKRIPKGTKVMVMVKAAAYGGGATEIANHLQKLKADYLSVAYPDEGVELRNSGITLPIMVLNAGIENFSQMQAFQLEPVIYSTEILTAIGTFSQLEGKITAVHLDLDTGMRRLGFEKKDLGQVRELLARYPLIRIKSVFTHLAGSDESQHDDFSLKQLSLFDEMNGILQSFLEYIPLKHALNTAGILRFPEYAMDMVRLGIGIYGIAVDEGSKGQLQQVGTLKTTISQVKTLNAGETVGYGRMGTRDRTTRIATIAIGYADGFDRRFSNGKGFGLVHGKKVPVIGNVCMDMTMLDIGDIPAKAGDEVTIFGEGIDLKELAKEIGTIPYELLTHISNRVKRVYFLD
ncbi:bifunctional UDP-N-acetylmuramoyl-tripeptide:D-alanyl-D-alanine ligase/alanine racemase [Lunatibacter salilacus]|uniref:bifunctional UDP-N-acetylmuramoyl-tripeptide:D-alanyl-D-alanine ligase/alanine racemase n=1 Tax=Lunatibacter salilacus TaxID=2483804 RepID=UPI00131DE8F4|nr:bifunctional UDP-N-acetylmuramoyl-tripeptide:D-alanyl-D-alanine ligase/alanine racemase [Lunatibacter salilacus]